jgi:hypothetical protein
MASAAKVSADALEDSKDGDDAWVETKEENGIAVESSAVPQTQLSMEARVTDQASEEIQALFDDIDENGTAPVVEDAEELRLESLKRKYQNAIGRLPYGIPAPELRDRDWVALAAALATGERKTVEEGREVTRIDGRWYFSDMKDTSTFLKEHGAKPKAAAPKKPATDNKDLLMKLEERFILGEITEETYKELVKKYS